MPSRGGGVKRWMDILIVYTTAARSKKKKKQENKSKLMNG